jgi:hypothetical protein
MTRFGPLETEELQLAVSDGRPTSSAWTRRLFDRALAEH